MQVSGSSWTSQAGGHGGRRLSAVQRIAQRIVKPFVPPPDQSLVNAKFTDALERDLLNRAASARRW